jgi:hypothetical protein
LVGNYGGIRSAAMLGFDLTKQAFVGHGDFTVPSSLAEAIRLPSGLNATPRTARVWPR